MRLCVFLAPLRCKFMKIKNKVIEEIIIHAQKQAPLEACGYLAANCGIIVESYALTNIDQSSEHFSFDPKEQFAALKNIREKSLEICAVYHSHPFSLARPSEEDIKLAYDSNMLYVIISLSGSKADVKAFKIQKQKIEQINLEIV